MIYSRPGLMPGFRGSLDFCAPLHKPLPSRDERLEVRFTPDLVTLQHTVLCLEFTKHGSCYRRCTVSLPSSCTAHTRRPSRIFPPTVPSFEAAAALPCAHSTLRSGLCLCLRQPQPPAGPLTKAIPELPWVPRLMGQDRPCIR